MQSLNDDMDELFRRASDEYPLNTKGADWDKVMQQLDHKEGALGEKDKEKNDLKFLWLLLLLPLGFVCGRYMSSHDKPVLADAGKDTKITTPPSGKTISDNSVSKETISKLKKDDLKGSDNINSIAEKDAFANTKVTSFETGSGKSNARLYRRENKLYPSSNAKVNVSNSSIVSSTLKAAKTKDEKVIASVENTNKAGNSLNDNSAATAGTFAEEAAKKDSEKRGNVSSVAEPGLPNTIDKKTTEDSIPHKKVSEVVEKSKGAIALKNKSRISYSLLFGPDISTVKSQKASNIGYTAGVLLSYRFSKRISVEGGVVWARRNYFSDGKYFDTNNMKLPLHSIVKSGDGYCNMFEIPVNVKYDFIVRKNSSVFVSAGLSSYLMKREEYDLSYMRYNQMYSKEYGYDNSSKNWFSIMNLNMGYQKSLGKSTTLGVVPYIKLPLHGVGIGKLPISSKGFYLTLTRSIK